MLALDATDIFNLPAFFKTILIRVSCFFCVCVKGLHFYKNNLLQSCIECQWWAGLKKWRAGSKLKRCGTIHLSLSNTPIIFLSDPSPFCLTHTHCPPHPSHLHVQVLVKRRIILIKDLSWWLAKIDHDFPGRIANVKLFVGWSTSSKF